MYFTKSLSVPQLNNIPRQYFLPPSAGPQQRGLL